jgi:predicted ATPase
MAAARPAGLLARVAVAGVAGLPELELDLGPLTALVGPRGSGKSQLLSSIAWLITGRPRIAASTDRRAIRVSGDLHIDGRITPIVRRQGAGLSFGWARDAASVLPACTFLRAGDRLGRPTTSGGTVGARLARIADGPTSDAVAAEALVSVVEACCQECLAGEILLLEEPELLLTPQAQRYLYRLVRRFAEGGNQVLYSTRSPAFVDAARHDEILRLDLRRGRRSLRRTSPQTLSDAERVRLAAEFDHERSEMFFARSVVLVEGQTERLSLPFIFRALGHDPDAEGIAIVEVGGKSNLPIAARILRDLEIPFVVVFDADRGTASTALDAQIRRSVGPAPIIRLEPDFEAAAGIASHDEKVYHAWRRFAAATPDAIPPALASIVAATAGLGAEPPEQPAP